MRPLAVATCDLDALIVAGGSPFQPPFAIGHECVAEVLDVGDAVRSVHAGQLVSVPFQISCGECVACRAGRTSNCGSVDFMSTYGFGPAVEQWGGFLADVVCVPYAEHMLVPVPAGLEPAAVASASDNIADAWRTVGPALARGAGGGRAGRRRRGSPARSGCTRPGSRWRSDRSRCCTSTLTKPGVRRRRSWVRRRSPRRPSAWDPIRSPSMLARDPDGLALALRSTSPDGLCTSAAIYFGEQPALPLLEMYTKGITFKTGRANARPAMPHVLELAASGALHPELVTTRTVSWSEAADALLERGWTKLVIER